MGSWARGLWPDGDTLAARKADLCKWLIKFSKCLSQTTRNKCFLSSLKNAKREVASNVIALLAMIIVLIVQYKAGWIKTGEGWSTVW